MEIKLQRVVDTVQYITEKLNLRISVKKTEGIVLKGNLDKARPPLIKLYNKSIRFTSTCRYLGVYLDKGITFKEHVKVQRNRLLGLMGKLIRVGSINWGLNKRTLATLYKGVFIPILTYGGYCWFSETSKIPIMKMLWASQRPFLLLLTKACRTVQMRHCMSWLEFYRLICKSSELVCSMRLSGGGLCPGRKLKLVRRMFLLVAINVG